VTLLASGWRGAAPRETLDGIEVHRTGGRHTFNLAAPLHYRRRMHGADFDLVVEDLNKVPLFAPLWVDRPVVLLVHHLFGRTAFEEATPPVAAMTWLLERPLARAYRGLPVEAVSESTAEDLVARGMARERITVIPNGVDLELYRPEPAIARFAEPTILYLGRLKRYKRVDLVIRALHRVREAGTPARLIVAGTGDDSVRLHRLVSELDLDDSVEMPGFVSEQRKVELFRRAWVHAFASPKEGWGISNLEAAACGTPTVASDSPGLRESVVHEQTGYLVPHGDVAAFARRLGELLSNAGLRDRLGRQARAFAEAYSWEAAADRTEAHLRAVLGRSST
jgi:glycosyltransferase involved in cell wall biosynthesis